ncbi:ATP synthase subunit H family protein [Babesia bovis T2Bo]|uniref:ATP synthase subunit H family protein n=1 Tax=Babesia bovis T2Bo TaxID=484906 RepID=UPI001C362060|nr:ATP synthase subunit H family protein [Babesia bovis T2Bo]KAG6440008.1 ATP synthase subunit H family protein [Babesia bovis T2Bo]
MDNQAFIRLMTICYAIAGALATIAVQLFFRNRYQGKERRDFYLLILLIVPLGTFCLWLLWFCMYIAQMHPMISPIKHFIHKAPEAAAEVPAPAAA